jgi:LPS-assembly lipoprotein
VRTGSTSAAVTYDSADQPYASVAAQQDSQERAAAEVARKIQLDLAAWLAGKAAA